MLGYAAEAETMSIEAAQKAGFISVRYVHDPTSNYYKHPLKVVLHNNSKKALWLQLANGTVLHASDPADQNLLVTKGEQFTLKENSTASRPVYAMCMEQHDRSPGAHSLYKTSGRVTGALLKLAQLIEEKNYHDDIGQDAVWCFTTPQSLKNISGTDTSESNLFRHFVSNATGEPYEPDLHIQPEATRSHNMYNGTITYNLHGIHSVKVVLINANYETVKECYRNDQEPEGAHEVNYQVATDTLPPGAYQMVFTVDGEERMRRSIRVE